MSAETQSPGEVSAASGKGPEPRPARPGEDVPPHPAPAPGRRGLGAALAFFLSLVALGGVGWNWWEDRHQMAQVRQDLAQRLSEFESASAETKALGERNQEGLRQAESRLGVVEGKIAESQSQQVALEALYQDLSRTRDETALAEAEQYLTIAAQQVQLGSDAKAALVALQHADARLATLDRPQVKALRQKIAADADALRALPYVDVGGMSIRLDQMVAGVERLPLASDARVESPREAPASTAEPGQPLWQRWLRQVWVEVKELVRIQRVDKPEPPLLAPNEAWFLRENLRLRLLSARLALLRGDQDTFRADLQAARDMTTRYFEISARPTAELLGAIDQLAETQIRVEMPDLAPTLEAARSIKLPREKVSP